MRHLRQRQPNFRPDSDEALTAIRERDYTQLQANMLLFSLVVATMSLLVDISYAWLDPRIRYS